MKYLKTYESMSDLASDSYHKRQERMRTLEDMSLELWDSNFNVQVSSEVLSRDDKYIVVNIVKRGQNRFNYTEIKDTFLSMISYMESEGHSISIEVSDKYVSNLIPVELKGDELFLKHRVSRIDGSYLMVDYPIEQLIIKFKE
jgi:hypothetical protein